MAAATAVAAGIARLDTVENAWQVAVSTRRLAAGSMSSLKCLKKSTPIIGNDTAAKWKVQVNFLLLNCKEMDLSLHNCTYVQLVGNSSRNEYSKTRSMVINPSSVTGKNLGTVLKKICEHHAGVEIRQTGISRQSGSSTHTVQLSILTENNLLLE